MPLNLSYSSSHDATPPQIRGSLQPKPKPISHMRMRLRLKTQRRLLVNVQDLVPCSAAADNRKRAAPSRELSHRRRCMPDTWKAAPRIDRFPAAAILTLTLHTGVLLVLYTSLCHNSLATTFTC